MVGTSIQAHIIFRSGLSTLTCSPPLVFDVDTQICNYQEVVTNCDREGRVPECTDELRDNSVCRETEQSESLDLPVSIESHQGHLRVNRVYGSDRV